jgi:hypothetical protein
MPRFLHLLILTMAAACTVHAAAPAQRTALVVGNAKYESEIGALKNTVNDAKLMAKTLRTLGFRVMEKQNVTRDELLRAMMEFRQTLPQAEVGLFYYAGHGISVRGANYLIPIKSGYSPEGADDVTVRMLAETRLFNVEQAVADMKAAGAACNLVILDACRNTPVARTERTREAGASGGLSEMNPPAGSLIAFATDAGQVAFDGDGANGLYTEELLKHLRTPGLTIEQVFKRTRAGVLERSGGNQIPAEYSRLIGEDVYLAGPAATAPVVATAPGEAMDALAEALSRAVKAEPVAPPTPAEIVKLASAGKGAECLEALRTRAETEGPGEYAVAPLTMLLEQVKDTLKEATGPQPKVLKAAETCEKVLEAMETCLPKEHERRAQLASKAHNRRGDALLLLGRAEEALVAYEAALPLAPEDAYILFNRGRAKLALGMKEEATADFRAADPKFNQPKARKMAEEALAGVK